MKKLIERVRAIDPEAARYIEEEAPKLDSYYVAHEPELISLFKWGETPKSYYYWGSISKQLGEI